MDVDSVGLVRGKRDEKREIGTQEGKNCDRDKKGVSTPGPTRKDV